MRKIQLRNEEGVPTVNVEVPDDDELAREDGEQICEAFGQILDQLGFDVSIGSTGGVDLEWYAAKDKADSFGEYNINISFNQ